MIVEGGKVDRSIRIGIREGGGLFWSLGLFFIFFLGLLECYIFFVFEKIVLLV